MPEATFERLRDLLATDFGIDPGRVTPDAHLRTDLGLDSLSLTDLALLVQSDFGFKVGPEAFRGVTTVGALSELIGRHAREPVKE